MALDAVPWGIREAVLSKVAFGVMLFCLDEVGVAVSSDFCMPSLTTSDGTALVSWYLCRIFEDVFSTSLAILFGVANRIIQTAVKESNNT